MEVGKLTVDASRDPLGLVSYARDVALIQLTIDCGSATFYTYTYACHSLESPGTTESTSISDAMVGRGIFRVRRGRESILGPLSAREPLEDCGVLSFVCYEERTGVQTCPKVMQRNVIDQPRQPSAARTGPPRPAHDGPSGIRRLWQTNDVATIIDFVLNSLALGGFMHSMQPRSSGSLHIVDRKGKKKRG